jgi:23S rRNA (uridine2552-2'-O)-methyltransferase
VTAGSGRRLTSGRKRTLSSRRWLERQLTDPYVIEAKKRGLRSRAAFKLIELDDRFRLLRPGARVVDLGAAPGGWTQVAVQRTGAGKPGGGRVVAFDIAPLLPLDQAIVLTLDIFDPDAPARVTAALGGRADVVLTDMAPPSSGHAGADHLRIVGLFEAALDFALDVLEPGGSFVGKVWQGGTETPLLARMKQRFRSVRHAKPKASRPESAELYVVATGFREQVPDDAETGES